MTATQKEKIAQRAYEIYQQRGGTGGQDLDDWLQAERELLTAEKPASAKPTKKSATKKAATKKTTAKKAAGTTRKSTKKAAS